MKGDIAAALFGAPPAIVEQARALIARDHGDEQPVDVQVRWLGVATALVAWHERGDDGTMFPKTATYTGVDARLLHEAEGGTASFPIMCRAERTVDGQVVVCTLSSPHYPIKHNDGDGTSW